MAYLYPLLLDVSDRLVVIIGGGGVAVRKAAGLVTAGATRIRCVAPAFSADLSTTVERIVGEYEQRHLDGAALVFAATNDRHVNSQVVQHARLRGILANRADTDDADPGDFATPAKIDAGPVIITVSAGSAALAAAIRNDLADKLDPRWVAMAEAMIRLRPFIRDSRLAPARRAEVFRILATPAALDTLQAGGVDGLRQWLLVRHPELNHG